MVTDISTLGDVSDKAQHKDLSVSLDRIQLVPSIVLQQQFSHCRAH